jgi:hypothetical protein
MDWFNKPLEATLIFLGLLVAEVIIFSLLLLLTMRVKIPKYLKMQEDLDARKLSGRLSIQGSRE